MNKIHAICIASASLCFANIAFPHGGGLNAEGCHFNRTTGDYHCHRSGYAAPSTGYAVTSGYQMPRQPVTGGAYRNCAEARAAGAAPIYRGQIGYAPHLDRDNDGIACEPYRGR